MATLKDIAKEANVSVMTVSNVIHNRTEKVSLETIEKVQSIIKKYNYTPNMNARSLVNRKSKLVAVVFFNSSESNDGTFKDPFNTELMAGIEEVLKKKEFYLLVQTVQTIKEIELIISKWNVDSVIIIGMLPQDVRQVEEKIEKPIVLIDTYYQTQKNHIYFVNSDDAQGARLATEHLIQLGHTDIGFISYGGLNAGGVVEKRYKSFYKTMTENNLIVNEETVLIYQNQFESLEKFCDRLIEKERNFSALVFAADIIALEVMQVLFDRGFKVPDDLSIIGFDDIYATSIVRPKLTTVRQEIHLKGNKAAEVIVQLIDGSKPEQICTMPVSLIIRQSTKNNN